MEQLELFDDRERSDILPERTELEAMEGEILAHEIGSVRKRLREILKAPKSFLIEQLRSLLAKSPWLQNFLSSIVLDALTKLPQRGAMEHALKTALEKVEEGDIFACAILMVDLDDFKKINLIYKHEGGDIVLQAISQKLLHRISYKRGDVVVRWGGDEFLILLNNFQADTNLSLEENRAKILEILHRRAEDILRAIREMYIEIPGKGKMRPSASIGVKVVFLDEPNIANQKMLIEEADQAAFDAKRQSEKGKIVFSGNNA